MRFQIAGDFARHLLCKGLSRYLFDARFSIPSDLTGLRTTSSRVEGLTVVAILAAAKWRVQAHPPDVG